MQGRVQLTLLLSLHFTCHLASCLHWLPLMLCPLLRLPSWHSSLASNQQSCHLPDAGQEVRITRRWFTFGWWSRVTFCRFSALTKSCHFIQDWCSEFCHLHTGLMFVESKFSKSKPTLISKPGGWKGQEGQIKSNPKTRKRRKGPVVLHESKKELRI